MTISFSWTISNVQTIVQSLPNKSDTHCWLNKWYSSHGSLGASFIQVSSKINYWGSFSLQVPQIFLLALFASTICWYLLQMESFMLISLLISFNIYQCMQKYNFYTIFVLEIAEKECLYGQKIVDYPYFSVKWSKINLSIICMKYINCLLSNTFLLKTTLQRGRV